MDRIWLVVTTGAGICIGLACGWYLGRASVECPPAVECAACPVAAVPTCPACAACPPPVACPACAACTTPKPCPDAAPCPPAAPCAAGEACIDVEAHKVLQNLLGGSKELPFAATYGGDVRLYFGTPVDKGDWTKVEVENKSGRTLQYCVVAVTVLRDGVMVDSSETNFVDFDDNARRVLTFIFDKRPRGNGVRFEIHHCR